MKYSLPIYALTSFLLLTSTLPAEPNTPVRFDKSGKTIKVFLGDQHFTTFDYENHAKPILYPIYGPGQIGMTRNWPMNKDVQGEAHDHPHHKSMWISHEISGVDFWAESEGTVKTDSVDMNFAGEPTGVFQATSSWMKKSDGKTLLTDQTAYRFGGDDKSRWIDCTITYRADHGDIEFDDTKEGLFAIRTHPDLRLSARPNQGVTEVFGKAINSEGVRENEIWGKRAAWIDYWAEIDGQTVGIAVFDHPSNLRHPTWWHARDYGLLSANPFGIHHFENNPDAKLGEYTLQKGDSLTFKHRFVIHPGNYETAKIADQFEAWSK